MKPTVLKAENKEEMDSIANNFLENGYKISSSEDVFVILRHNSYGNLIIHGILIFLTLFVSILAIIGNVVYFAYYFFKKSDIVLITTETTDADGNPVDFYDKKDILFLNEGTD
jgi:hypothetical protein